MKNVQLVMFAVVGAAMMLVGCSMPVVKANVPRINPVIPAVVKTCRKDCAAACGALPYV